LDTVCGWFGFSTCIRLSELIEKLLFRCASLFACMMNQTFQTVEKQDCSAMLNQIVQQRMNNLPNKNVNSTTCCRL
jgi:hypothetical protein